MASPAGDAKGKATMGDAAEAEGVPCGPDGLAACDPGRARLLRAPLLLPGRASSPAAPSASPASAPSAAHPSPAASPSTASSPSPSATRCTILLVMRLARPAPTYATTSCSVCDSSGGEDLLLLCELCDAAAHTYCVGLGAAVPEGDWFCKDCAASKEEHSRCEADDGWSGGQGEFDISVEVPRIGAAAGPSGFDTVGEGFSMNSPCRRNVQSSGTSVVDPVPSIYDIVDEDYATNPVCRTNARSSRAGRNA